MTLMDRWHVPGPNTVRVYVLYGGIAGLTFALSWPKDSPLNWYFVGGIVLQVFVAWKALASDPKTKDQQEDGEVSVPAQTLKVDADKAPGDAG